MFILFKCTVGIVENKIYVYNMFFFLWTIREEKNRHKAHIESSLERKASPFTLDTRRSSERKREQM